MAQVVSFSFLVVVIMPRVLTLLTSGTFLAFDLGFLNCSLSAVISAEETTLADVGDLSEGIFNIQCGFGSFQEIFEVAAPGSSVIDERCYGNLGMFDFNGVSPDGDNDIANHDGECVTLPELVGTSPECADMLSNL